MLDTMELKIVEVVFYILALYSYIDGLTKNEIHVVKIKMATSLLFIVFGLIWNFWGIQLFGG